jgi:predicted GIY-YIG superfamily endonuclease
MFESATRICGIYCIRNKSKNRVYIGASSDCQQRIETHIRSLENGTHFCKDLLEDWKSDYNQIDFQVLQLCLRKNLQKWERKFIRTYVTSNNVKLYNRQVYKPYKPVKIITDWPMIQERIKRLGFTQSNIAQQLHCPASHLSLAIHGEGYQDLLAKILFHLAKLEARQSKRIPPLKSQERRNDKEPAKN